MDKLEYFSLRTLVDLIEEKRIDSVFAWVILPGVFIVGKICSYDDLSRYREKNPDLQKSEIDKKNQDLLNRRKIQLKNEHEKCFYMLHPQMRIGNIDITSNPTSAEILLSSVLAWGWGDSPEMQNP